MKYSHLVKGALVIVILPALIATVLPQRGRFTPSAALQREQAQLAQVQREAPAAPGGDAPIEGEKVALEVAQARLPWSIPLPSHTISSATLTETWVSFENFNPADRQLYLIYSNGLRISIWHEPVPLDFSTWEAPFRTVTVKGITGIGKDPGTQYVEGYGENRYPGSVTWWENGLLITIYGEFPAEQLIQVAESMPAITDINLPIPALP